MTRPVWQWGSVRARLIGAGLAAIYAAALLVALAVLQGCGKPPEPGEYPRTERVIQTERLLPDDIRFAYDTGSHVCGEMMNGRRFIAGSFGGLEFPEQPHTPAVVYVEPYNRFPSTQPFARLWNRLC